MSQQRRQFDIVDASGVRLSVVWSRSGKTAGVALMSPGYTQIGLTADQAEELGEFLCGDPEPRSAIALRDPDAPQARLEAAWNPAAARLTITLQPVWEGVFPQVELRLDDVAKLGRYLAAGSPGPQ